MILIGSAPLKMARGQDVKEYDIIATGEERKQFEGRDLRIDFHDYNALNNSDVATRFTSDNVAMVGGVFVPTCTLRGLAHIKRSHLWRSRFFDKHIAAYHRDLAQHIGPIDTEFLEERIALTRAAYPQGNPSLAQTNEDFFDDAVTKIYDHDDIHEIVAYYDRPVYTMMKRDDSKAWCEKDMWDDLPESHKLSCVAEECYVIAIERFMVPNGWKFPAKHAYFKALEKVCTTLTSGWFRDFAIDNYPAIVDMFDKRKFETVKERLDELIS